MGDTNSQALHETVRHVLTTIEAVAFVKRAPAGVRFAAAIRTDAPIADEPGRVFPDGLHSYVHMSRKDALRVVGGMLSEKIESRGGRIEIRVVTFKSVTGDRVTYWVA